VMTGCDPCPACTTRKPIPTLVTLTGVSVVVDEEVPVSVSGVPVLLSQLSH
jgi:hypothetical protein